MNTKEIREEFFLKFKTYIKLFMESFFGILKLFDIRAIYRVCQYFMHVELSTISGISTRTKLIWQYVSALD